MAVRPIDGNALIEWFRPYLHTGEAIPADVVIEDIHSMPTLTTPSEWVSRVQELDELCTKLQIATGFTAEQLLEMFAAGYTLEKPDYSKHFEAMANLTGSDPPNEPLTLERLREMDEPTPVWWEKRGFGAFANEDLL